MKKSDILIVIPARYAATRFEGKLLKLLNNKPIIQWVYEACKKAKLGEVLIATDDKRVVKIAKEFGAKAVITSKNIESGTDRIYHVAKNRDEKFIINVQGDEPFIRPEIIKSIAALLKKDKKTDIATACIKTQDPNVITNPNCVKATLTENKTALYFSRAAIPFIRDIEKKDNILFYHHFGIYGYKKEALQKFVDHKQTVLEKLEKLEQLRALEIGLKIKSIIIDKVGPSIDTPRDLDRAKELLKTKK